MSSLQTTDKLIAIFCSDLHLQSNTPRARLEKDWFEVQKRTLDEVNRFSEAYKCPVFCAGDIFDNWRSNIELVNFAIQNIDHNWHTIAGQHDLPYHDMNQIYKSPYKTLDYCKSTHFNLYENGNLSVHGFNWKEEIPLLKRDKNDKRIHVAIVHEYIWIDGCSFTGCDEKSKLSNKKTNLLTYDLVVFGDNHKGFLTELEDTIIFNCGSMINRHIDQIDYKPHIGLLTDKGELVLHYLDTSKDLFDKDIKPKTDKTIDDTDFLAELKNIETENLDFCENIKSYIRTNEINDNIYLKITGAMNNERREIS